MGEWARQVGEWEQEVDGQAGWASMEVGGKRAQVRDSESEWLLVAKYGNLRSCCLRDLPNFQLVIITVICIKSSAFILWLFLYIIDLKFNQNWPWAITIVISEFLHMENI